jgi:TPR repeat protein
MMYDFASVSDRFADRRWPALDLGAGYLLVDFEGHEIGEEAQLPSMPAIAIDNPRSAFTLAMALQRRYFEEDARRWYERVIAAGSVSAMNNLAVLMAEGEDYGQARTLLEDAVNRGSMTAAYNAWLLATRRDDSAAGFRWLKHATDSNHVPSMIMMAREALDENSYEEAHSWLRRAAEAGDARAANLLGLLLNEEDQPALAEKCLTAAANRGHLAAMSNLAVMVEDRDPELAERWYKQAAAEGSALAFLIQVSRNTQRDERRRARMEHGPRAWDEAEDDETLEDTDLDADAGGLTAMLNLAGFRWQQGDRRAAEQLYGELGGAGVVEAVLGQAELFAEQGRNVEASICYQRAAESGLNDARVTLARIYSQSRSNRDAEAEELLRAAAEEDHPAGLRELALRSQSQGNDAEAIALFERAAGLGDVKSMTFLGELYYHNDDEDTAREWLTRAAEADYPRAMAILGCIALEPTADASEHSPDAVRWLSRAAQAGEPIGMNNPGVLLCNQGNLDGGELWLRRAFAIGVRESLPALINWSFQTGNLGQAEAWCSRAAEAGIPAGCRQSPD